MNARKNQTRNTSPPHKQRKKIKVIKGGYQGLAKFVANVKKKGGILPDDVIVTVTENGVTSRLQMKFNPNFENLDCYSLQGILN